MLLLEKYFQSCQACFGRTECEWVNPSNASNTFVQSTRMQTFFWTSKPCHVGIHWIALAEYSQMSTHTPGFQWFFIFLHHFVLDKLALSSLRVKRWIKRELDKYPLPNKARNTKAWKQRNLEIYRDRLINRTYRLIAHLTSDFDDWLQFYKIDYLKSFLKK